MTKIVERNLRPTKDGPVLGYCHSDGLIEIDPRQCEESRLETLTHELLHREFPDLSEEAVERVARAMGKSLWGQGYRRTLF